jgi:phage gp45-like
MASSINLQADVIVSTLTKAGDATGNLTLQTNGNSALTINTSQNITFNGTGAFTVPVGNTAQRPSPAANGMIRYNTTTVKLEGYINSAWANIA